MPATVIRTLALPPLELLYEAPQLPQFDLPEGLAEALSEHFKVELHAPTRSGQRWELHVLEPLP